MRKFRPFCAITAALMLLPDVALSAQRPPNIVFFALDDLCDWVSPLGFTQARTPNMDRLAASGLVFTNAHSAGVFCAPARSALFTGRHASSTGCYTTQVYHHDHPDIKPLQMVLKEGGYATYGAGKLFHHPAGYADLRGWSEFFIRSEDLKLRGWPLDIWTTDMDFLPKPFPHTAFNRGRDMEGGMFLEWGPIRNEDEPKMSDTICTDWICEVLRRKHERPFFAALGLYAPHFPNYAPKKYFDLYNRSEIRRPPIKNDDLADLPPAVRRAKQARSAIHKKLESLGEVEDAILGYLACVSYADAMLGKVLDAIESGPNAANTVLVLWSDQGYHHGEKFDWGKHTLWERTSNIPLLIAGPGVAKGARVDSTVSLIDLFPTVTGIAGIKDDQPRDGVSLVPVLNNPSSAKDRDVLLHGMKPGDYAVINRNWRYIRYADGGEELYDQRKDPNEWNNLAGKNRHSGLKAEMRGKAPSRFAKPGPTVEELRLRIEGQSFRWEKR